MRQCQYIATSESFNVNVATAEKREDRWNLYRSIQYPYNATLNLTPQMMKVIVSVSFISVRVFGANGGETVQAEVQRQISPRRRIVRNISKAVANSAPFLFDSYLLYLVRG